MSQSRELSLKLHRLRQELETLRLYGYTEIEGRLDEGWIEKLKAAVVTRAQAKPQEEMKRKNAAQGAEGLAPIRKEVEACHKCELSGTRTNTVFGVGNPKARLMFIGEAPGADEDKKGEPFVGRAGQLLTSMIEAMGLRREDVYIANILKCRPPGNRNPLPGEVELCEPYLVRKIKGIKPEVICALGAVSAKTLLKTNSPISRLRGEFHSYHGTPLLPTFHPAYLLRNPGAKKDAWNDLKMVMNKVGIPVPDGKKKNG